MTNREKVLNALKAGALNLATLQSKLDFPNVSVVLAQLTKAGRLTKKGSGKTALYTRAATTEPLAADRPAKVDKHAVLYSDDAFLVSLTKDRRLLMQKEGIPFIFSAAETKAIADLLT